MNPGDPIGPWRMCAALRACAAVAVSLFVASCAMTPPAGGVAAAAPANKPAPKLVLFMVIDGFPQEQLVKYYDNFGKGGFDCCSTRAPGTATITTAMPPPTPASAMRRCCRARIRTSMASSATTGSTRRPRARLFDRGRSTQVPRRGNAGTFRHVAVQHEGHDGRRRADLRERQIEGGHDLGQGSQRDRTRWPARNGLHAQRPTGRFITSDYYMAAYPDWWRTFYENRPQDSYFGRQWTLLLPEAAYARSTLDDQPWVTHYKGLGKKFPHAISGGASSRTRRTTTPCSGPPTATTSRSTSSRLRSKARTWAATRPMCPTCWPSAGPVTTT